MSATILETAPSSHLNEEELRQNTAEHVAQRLAPQAIEAAGAAVKSFYGGEDHFIGRTQQGEYRSLVVKDKDGSKNETVGSGEDPQSALESALEGMRSLETIQTRPLIRIKMNEKAAVDFTELGHYAPKIAPSTEAYPIPDYLEHALTDFPIGDMTYKETVAKKDWDKELTGIVSNYLTANEHGQRIAKELKITDLSALTPEQAVKLSLGVVQNLSKYTSNEAGVPDGKRADKLTTMQLLQEGIDNKADSDWKGNGVCRNVASNTKAVFEALKMNQGEHSMLRNTYAVFEAGFDGDGYDDKREDIEKKLLNSRAIDADPKLLPGHAWVKFITVDAKGSANIAIVDPTWALEQDAPTALQHMDYTLPRMTNLAGELFAKSENKKEAFEEFSYYFDKLNRRALADQGGSEKIANTSQFAMAEYIKAADALLPELSEGDSLRSVPENVAAAAYRLQDRLQSQELETLYKISQFAENQNMQTIVESYVRGTMVQRPDYQTILRLVQPEDDLQEKIFDAMDDQDITKYADVSGNFRARLRELRPDSLPAFDASSREADAKELRFLVDNYNIRSKTPDHIGRELRRKLRSEAGSDDVYEAVTFGRSDYDLAKHFNGLRDRMAKIAQQ